MRITNSMLAGTTLRNLNITVERLDKLQDQLTSGQKIGAPSDDPIGTAASLEFRTTLGELEQYVKNAEAATSWLDATDAALDTITQVLQRARDLGTQGASDTTALSDKQAMANEVSQLIDQAIALGNSKYAGQSLFAGVKVNTTPFSAVGNPPASVTYSGDSVAIARQINSRSSVTVNIPGDTALGQVFSAVIALRDALTSGSSTSVSSTLADVDSAMDSVISVRSQVGARMNRVGSEKERLESLKLNIAGLLSKVQDVDMTEAISAFAVQQNVYQAALAAGAKAILPSLLDYLK